MVQAAVINIPGDDVALELRAEPNLNGKDRVATVDAFNCLIATPGSLDWAVQFQVDALKEIGYTLFTKVKPNAIVCIGHKYKDETGMWRWREGNYGVEIQLNGRSSARLAMSEGLEYVEFEVMVLHARLVRCRPLHGKDLPWFGGFRKPRVRDWPDDGYPGIIELEPT
ncbi:MAG: hypothetical protein HONBIEJF_02875 [Fimbriimonadaceae bacterium]|nr:hypothetical protein [Fimbriimonadaceae bacterium]